MVECPHCGCEIGGAAGAPEGAHMQECPACLRAFGRCPTCGAAVRLYDYWRKPGVMPPLPPDRAGRKITFTAETDHRGDRATFDEEGHQVILWQTGRALDWLRCPTAG